MNIDVVIGNPPYQEVCNNTSSNTKPLFDKFTKMGIDITDKLLVFITNNTFLTNDSKKELRDSMIRAGLKKLYNYPISGDIFNGVGINVCIFEINKEIEDKSFEYRRIEHSKIVNQYTSSIEVGEIIAESEFELSIPRKLKGYRSMSEIVTGDKTFGLSSNGLVGFTGRREPANIQLVDFDGSIKLKNRIHGEDSIDYIAREDVPNGIEYIDKFKVICPKIITKQSQKSFDKVEILPPQYICTQNWSTIGAFETIEEATNLSKYVRTKFFKFLARTFSSNAMTSLSKVLMSHIPLQDFTSASDIDWSQSIADIDKQLYRKYNLSEEEIAYIEKTIKTIE